MNLNNADVAFHDIEARKRELIRQAQIERLAQTACEHPAQVQRGWKRLIAALLDSPAKLQHEDAPRSAIESRYRSYKVS
jgi:hypothetical protein